MSKTIIDDDVFYELQRMCIKRNISVDKVITDLIKTFIMKNLNYDPNFVEGLNILKKYEPNPRINNMGDGEFYVGDMNIWEYTITKKDLNELEKLGFRWYDEAECLLFETHK